MLGNGGGVGIIIPKAKIIMTRPNPTESIELITSLIDTLSAEELLTISSMALVAIEVLLLYLELNSGLFGTIKFYLIIIFID